MGNASRQSKQKQQTSKKGSQGSQEPKTNGDIAPVSRNVFLTIEQAVLFKQLLTASNETEANFKQAESALLDIQRQIHIALIAAGLPGDEIVGGNLDGDKPYFTVKDDNGVVKE